MLQFRKSFSRISGATTIFPDVIWKSIPCSTFVPSHKSKARLVCFLREFKVSSKLRCWPRTFQVNSFPSVTAFNVWCCCLTAFPPSFAYTPNQLDIQVRIKFVLKTVLGDLREKFSRERSGQSVSLLNHLKQGLLPWNSQLQCLLH